MIDALLIHRATIRHMAPAGAADRFGNRPLTHDSSRDETIRCRVEPTASTEETTDREEQRGDFVVFLPPSVTMTGSDEIIWDDRDVLLRFEGDPVPVYDGVGLHHFEAVAFRVRG